MKIILKVTKINDKITDIEGVMAYNDSDSTYHTSLGTILNALKTINKDPNISFIAIYTGSYKFEDCVWLSYKNPSKNIHFLLRIVDDKDISIVKVSSSHTSIESLKGYFIEEYKYLKCERNVRYETCSVYGSLVE